MKRKLLVPCFLIVAALSANASGYSHQEPLKLNVEEMPPVLTTTRTMTADLRETLPAPLPGISEYATRTKPHYTFIQDQTWVGIPLFLAGVVAKSEKKAFRQDYKNVHANTRLITNFHSEVDDYMQFVPMLGATALNLAGVEGRSDFLRYLASGAMSYAIMAAIVNPIKYSTSEIRPDGSTRNSWPSGHTATAFVSATILHKEYGLTRSPWYSVAGYGIATTTGVMRVLNNRHWISDVLSGAGIGILSTELAYGLSDILFKDTHLKRGELTTAHSIIDNPSFFSISMGIGLGSKNLNFEVENLTDGTSTDNIDIKLQASTVVGAEGAYFFNKHVGVGGRLRVRSSPVKGWNEFMVNAQKQAEEVINTYSKMGELASMVKEREFTIESDHLTEFAGDVGVYFQLPLSKRLALGSKLLIGRSTMQELDVDAHFTGEVKDFQYKVTIENGEVTDIINAEITNSDKTYDVSWDYLTLGGNNTTKYGTGLSLTYAYKHNFSWKLFVDYDYSKKTYTMKYAPYKYLETAIPLLVKMGGLFGMSTEAQVYEKKKNMHTWVIGGSFAISF